MFCCFRAGNRKAIFKDLAHHIQSQLRLLVFRGEPSSIKRLDISIQYKTRNREAS